MNDSDSVLLSVSAEARQLVAPDYAVLDGLIEHTEASKVGPPARADDARPG